MATAAGKFCMIFATVPSQEVAKTIAEGENIFRSRPANRIAEESIEDREAKLLDLSSRQANRRAAESSEVQRLTLRTNLIVQQNGNNTAFSDYLYKCGDGKLDGIDGKFQVGIPEKLHFKGGLDELCSRKVLYYVKRSDETPEQRAKGNVSRLVDNTSEREL